MEEAVRKMQAFPKSDDFAVLLGLAESKIGTPPAKSEQHKLDVINLLYIPRLHLEHPLQQDVVFSRFAAYYLPALIARYLDPPAPSASPQWKRSIAFEDLVLVNAYGMMLVHLNGNSYFDKFFRSEAQRAARQALIKHMLRALDERTADWQSRLVDPEKRKQGGIAVESMIFDYCQLLTSLLLFETAESVQALNRLGEVMHLKPFLEFWNQQLAQSDLDKKPGTSDEEASRGGEDMQHPAATLLFVLQGGADEYERAALMRARSEKGRMTVCAMIGCDRTRALDGESLLGCSRCGTVRYCSEEHSHKAWKDRHTMHKEMCHKSVF